MIEEETEEGIEGGIEERNEERIEERIEEDDFGSAIGAMQIIPAIIFLGLGSTLVLTLITESIPEFPGALESSILIVTLIIYGAARSWGRGKMRLCGHRGGMSGLGRQYSASIGGAMTGL